MMMPETGPARVNRSMTRHHPEQKGVKMSDKDAVLRLENQLCFPLYAAARKVTSLYTPYFKPLGLTYTQYIVLLVL